MSSEIDYKSITEIIVFLKNVIECKRILKKSSGIVDSNRIFKLFKFQIQNDDSGFESEPISQYYYNAPCFVPATELSETIFEKSDLSETLENYLSLMCTYIQTSNPELNEDKAKIEGVLEFTIKFVEFLAEGMSNVPFQEVIQKFLESMLNKALADFNKHFLFNFVLELFQRFGKVKDLQGDICDIIIQNLLTFAKSVKHEDLDASASFQYVTEFGRANSLLFSLLIMKKQSDYQYSHQNIEDFFEIFDIFSKLDDFFSLGLLCHKHVLYE